MNLEDYAISICFDKSGEVYWSVTKKGESHKCNIEELKMVSNTLNLLRMRIDFITGEPLDGLDSSLQEQGLCYKDGEIVELSNVSENGKECKPANFAKSSKDLQELTNSCKIVKDLQEAKDLTSFELGLLLMLTDVSELSTIDCVKKHSTKLLATAYNQYRQDQMNQEFATFTRQEFNEAVDEEIKRRCDGIDVDKIVKDYRCFGLSYDPEQTEFERLISIYRQGVIDTIKKLKTK